MTTLDKMDKKIVNNKKKKKKNTNLFFYKFISFLLIILSIGTIIYIGINEVLSLFILVPISIVLLFIVFIFSSILNNKRVKKWLKNIFSFLAIIVIIIESVIILFGAKTLDFLNQITDTGYRVSNYGVYVLNDSNYNKINDLNNKNLSYQDTIDNKVLSLVKKDINIKIETSKTIDELVNKLTSKKVDAIIMEESYESILEEENSDLYSQIRLIKNYDYVNYVKTLKSNKDISKEPFVVYISGIDTTGSVASKARSDVNILLSFNPNTNEILLVNTPRDYYVNLKSKGKKDKLTHAGLYGIEESVSSLADLYDINIDYYVRINFTSFMKIIDELGGIEVDVPITFCEQNSKRSKANKDLICLKKGKQTLNGEEALALARHRHTLATGDRGRGENQMLILEAMIRTSTSPKVITKYSTIMNTLKSSVITNAQSNEIIKLVKKEIKNKNTLKISSMSATGTDGFEACYAVGNLKAYVMKPDLESVNNIKNAFNNILNNEVN